ncbi:MAG: hypothetical protein KDH20_15270 [Rhodocyclaceae bacterium]|nr:hypothetical protein [Rhodocyclaceae bacterium]
MREFVHYYLSQASVLVDEVRYVPLASDRYQAVRRDFDAWLQTRAGRRAG